MKKETLAPFEKALSKVCAAVEPVKPATVPLALANGLVLRGDVKADRPLPPFNRSAMDGYAVRFADIEKGLRRFACIGTLEAGGHWHKKVGPGEALKIMTGAPVPTGLDMVIKVEHTRIAGGLVEYAGDEAEEWLNIHRCGADAKKGETLIKAGQTFTPGRVAVASAVGALNVRVSPRIKVAVLSTGNELVPTAQRPTPFQIRDSNGPFLMARLAGLSIVEPFFCGIAGDDPKALGAALSAALKKADVVLLSGGVSMGERDFTPAVLKSLKVEKVIHKSAIRPGKPIWFGTRGKKAVFGLPGNPVSVAVTFHEFVLPALRKMAGLSNFATARLQLPLSTALGKKHSLCEFRVAKFSADGASVCGVPGYGGSGDFVAAAQSDGVIVLPEDARLVEAGTMVEFHPWNI